MVGLGASGKTTMLHKLKLDEVVITILVVGFNVESVGHEKSCITIWDVRGQDKTRHMWRRQCQGADGLTYVVASSDRDRIEDAKAEFYKMLNEDEMCDAVVLQKKSRTTHCGRSCVEADHG